LSLQTAIDRTKTIKIDISSHLAELDKRKSAEAKVTEALIKKIGTSLLEEMVIPVINEVTIQFDKSFVETEIAKRKAGEQKLKS